MSLQPLLNGELVVPSTVAIPADIDALAGQLDGLARLAVASEWARAAIVAAYVEVKDGPGQPKSIVSIDNTLESTVDFAARGFAGLTSPFTVRHYAKAWLDRG